MESKEPSVRVIYSDLTRLITKCFLFSLISMGYGSTCHFVVATFVLWKIFLNHMVIFFNISILISQGKQEKAYATDATMV